ncbi:VOC family protein [Mycolicibacterium sp. P1-18]|uniref:VOC family protein n=1 Tax=Mycolicibacterium sp. P1-18 TaxID=2024615 RepID=UPI0011F26713|nr:VOC family protein [Mycolicibacterium sp. P1-18]KAA0099666.1 VOC family protein [Mycolicibacterium sp. P1-18]
MTPTNTIRLASVRVITTDVHRAVRFYEILTGVTPNYLTDDFAELVTPSATLAVSHASRVPSIADDDPGAATKPRCIVEFWADDAEALLSALEKEFGDDLDVVQPPTLMPWGNVSVLIRDPDGVLVNVYTPVTSQAWQLQRNRTPRAELPAAGATT